MQQLKSKLVELMAEKQIKYWSPKFCEQHGVWQPLCDATPWLAHRALPERVFCIVNDIDRCIPCSVCDNSQFDRTFKGMAMDVDRYLASVCSQKCMIKARTAAKAAVAVKRKCAHPDCDNMVKGKRQFCGVKCRSTSEQWINSRKATNLAKYGHTNVLASDHGKSASKDTMLERYGVSNARQREEAKVSRKQQSFDTATIRFAGKATPMFSPNDIDRVNSSRYYPWKCIHCDCVFNNRLCSKDGTVRCPKCNPHNISKAHDEISQWLTSLGVAHTNNDRSVIPGIELDIYIGSHKLAIEYDGLYWHREQVRGRTYHMDKTEACEQQGISLLHIFEDEWKDNKDVVLSVIQSKLGLHANIVAARKCEVVELSTKQKQQFLKQNHLQGGDRSNYNIALSYQDEIVAVATFCKARSTAVKTLYPDFWELSRLAFKQGTTVAGGVSKLVKHFERQRLAPGLYTFADRRYSTGNGYHRVMQYSHTSPPSYWYFKNGDKRWHRYNFAKHTLAKKLGTFDPDKTEYQNMLDNGYDRVWDCGNLCYQLPFA